MKELAPEIHRSAPIENDSRDFAAIVDAIISGDPAALITYLKAKGLR